MRRLMRSLDTLTHRPASGPLCFFPAVNTADTVLNISCYKFVPLPDAAALRDVLHERAVGSPRFQCNK